MERLIRKLYLVSGIIAIAFFYQNCGAPIADKLAEKKQQEENAIISSGVNDNLNNGQDGSSSSSSTDALVTAGSAVESYRLVYKTANEASGVLVVDFKEDSASLSVVLENQADYVFKWSKKKDPLSEAIVSSADYSVTANGPNILEINQVNGSTKGYYYLHISNNNGDYIGKEEFRVGYLSTPRYSATKFVGSAPGEWGAVIVKGSVSCSLITPNYLISEMNGNPPSCTLAEIGAQCWTYLSDPAYESTMGGLYTCVQQTIF